MNKLKQILAQPDTIFFIGSGISLWSGLPTWSGMIEELALFVEQSGEDSKLIRREAINGDLLQAASYGFDKLTKQQIGEFIRLACRSGKARPHEIHKKIVTLGPRCFITTNYDNLIEVSLNEWQPERFYRGPVTNRHLTEMAEVVHARAIDFVFKPHGDANDSDSIVLTREQYRKLLPQGERQAALESVKLLLASRPVVYLGFGLRDPDFIYIRDLLANTYKGGARDHYAIMADVHRSEIDYWRRNYGIHLVGYETQERQDGGRDHTPLLALLDELVEDVSGPEVLSSFDPSSSDVLLSLARHAAVLGRQPRVSPELPIRVSIEERRYKYIATGFYNGTVEKFFDVGPDRALLIGHPGAGKTYALRRAAARYAECLHQVCVAEEFDRDKVVVPILADLKLYRGNLFELVSQTLPESLPFQELINNFKVKVFLDSFNEMPREFWEGGVYEADFSEFIAKLGVASLVIGSRTNDGLAAFGLQIYNLDKIEEGAVVEEITRQGIILSGRFSRELLWLLQRPFFFQFVTSKTINLQDVSHPIDFYRQLLGGISVAFRECFDLDIDVEGLLAVVAYEALNRGEEAFPVSSIISVFNDGLAGAACINSSDAVNWLVSKSILVPYTKGRIGFAHQSITEYLAAAELARRYMSAPRLLKEKLALRRWDQALFLCLSLLPAVQANDFINEVVLIDFALAVDASKYLEFGREEVVTVLLDKIIQSSVEVARPVEYAIERGLQVTEKHEQQLREIINMGDVIGGAAISLLISIKGAEVKREMLGLLVTKCDDFNFCSGIASALRDIFSEEDLPLLLEIVDKVRSKFYLKSDQDMEKFCGGFMHAVGALLEPIKVSVIKDVFLGGMTDGQVDRFRGEIVCSSLHSENPVEALCLAGEMLLSGIDKAAFPIYFIANFSEPKESLSWGGFSNLHALRLLEMLADPWAFKALQKLCEARPDIADIVRSQTLIKSGLQKLILLCALSSSAIDDLADQFEEEIISILQKQNMGQLKELEVIDWDGMEELVFRLLKFRNKSLASAVLGDGISYVSGSSEILCVEDVCWWLDWMQEEYLLDPHSWFCARLANFLGRNMASSSRAAFLSEFNRADTAYRKVMLSVMAHGLDASTDELSEDAISFILSELAREDRSFRFSDDVLGFLPTERFVVERILPMLPKAEGVFRRRLLKILDRAGGRHSRRYLAE